MHSSRLLVSTGTNNGLVLTRQTITWTKSHTMKDSWNNIAPALHKWVKYFCIYLTQRAIYIHYAITDLAWKINFTCKIYHVSHQSRQAANNFSTFHAEKCNKNLPIMSDSHRNLQPITLTIFHHNSNSTKISFGCHSNSYQVIITKFCTCHDSCAVMACAKFVVIWWSEIVHQWHQFFSNFESSAKIVSEMGPWPGFSISQPIPRWHFQGSESIFPSTLTSWMTCSYNSIWIHVAQQDRNYKQGAKFFWHRNLLLSAWK